MKNKIEIFIKIPQIEQEINLLIPLNKKVGNIKKEILKIVSDSYTSEINNMNLSLYDKETGKIILNNQYVKDCNIYNGQVLILI